MSPATPNRAEEDSGLFSATLDQHGLVLERLAATTLQVNVGLLCNQTCTHCHLEAGPRRREIMPRQTMQQIVEFASGGDFEAIDITGGAPEMNPHLNGFIEDLSRLNTKLILRSNLSVLHQKGEPMMKFLRDHRVEIVASFPSLNEIQTASLRGKGVFKTSVEALQKLNHMGYGRPGSERTLDLVVNPSGAFLSPSQESLEKRFRQVLKKKWDIRFNQLFSFANVPLGRFRSWLLKTGNYQAYMDKLTAAFNPQAVEGLMCRRLLSVSWDGYLFDCDFNQGAGVHMAHRKTHISEISQPPQPGAPIAVAEHCFTCTAGAGFT